MTKSNSDALKTRAHTVAPAQNVTTLDTTKGSSARIEKRREREIRTISQMIAMYCSGKHNDRTRSYTAACGEALCEECAVLDAYAVERTRQCRNMEHKTSCEECGNHCYSKAMRENIRTVMRYSGPRMLTKHPIAAIRHLLKK